MDKKLVTFVCKMCGRALKAEVKPNFCYFDRMSSIENISDEDAIKMGLFSTTKGCTITFPIISTDSLLIELDKNSIMETNTVTFEFLKDIKYNPFTGRKMGVIGAEEFLSLTDFQNMIMRRVINANK